MTFDPHANAIIKCVHHTVHNMLRVTHLIDNDDCGEVFGFDGCLTSVRCAINFAVHTTLCVTPTQLVFESDALLNVAFQADWELIKEHKQKLILEKNGCENSTWHDHTCAVCQEVHVKQQPNRNPTANKARAWTNTEVLTWSVKLMTMAPSSSGPLHVELSARHGTLTMLIPT